MKRNLKSILVNILNERKEKRQICKESFLLILLCHYSKVETSCFCLLPMEIIVMIFHIVLKDLASSLELKLIL